jgi:hypothetical protein
MQGLDLRHGPKLRSASLTNGTVSRVRGGSRLCFRSAHGISCRAMRMLGAIWRNYMPSSVIGAPQAGEGVEQRAGSADRAATVRGSTE